MLPDLGNPKALCTDCHTTPAMTPQCTDQCVVVACTGDHTPAWCDAPCPGDHCDLDCESADCKDCNGFDEFLSCCTDFHSYYEEPRNGEPARVNHPEPTWSWDPALKTFVCTCGGGSTLDSIPCGADNSDLPPALFDKDFPVSADVASTPSPGTEPVPDNSPFILPCMWGDCSASFSSLSQLVEHVNLVHLCYSSSPSLPSSPNARDFSAMSCQWKDCNIYPTPDSVPGPSSGDIDSILGVLHSHLLHDHLGLTSPPNYSHNTPSPEAPRHGSHPVELDLPEKPAVPLLPLSEDKTQAEHICQWVACGQRFSSLDELTSHLTTVHVGAGKTSYDCYWQDCPRNGQTGFASKQKLCRHLQSHTGHRPFQCSVCLQNFSEAATLQQHMRRHTLEKPYLCDYPGCGKSFAITGALTIHKRTHNGDRPFKCPHCDKAFSESSNLSKHLRTHTGAKPYTCAEPDCNKSFARADQLTRHARVHRKVTNS
ncbi:hypothetical protein B0H15DRAFT_558010 [Mycena belliarum]|uniref:C2H2-type domain-containing protein n=1 Tax=Mycena belliarum TaxID=1033014 RepID=A0AAD6TXE9_9AGAR|nr:hypothetical protein B0H15DRAFT_558010 [Mycena belliae]